MVCGLLLGCGLEEEAVDEGLETDTEELRDQEQRKTKQTAILVHGKNALRPHHRVKERPHNA